MAKKSKSQTDDAANETEAVVETADVVTGMSDSSPATVNINLGAGRQAPEAPAPATEAQLAEARRQERQRIDDIRGVASRFKGHVPDIDKLADAAVKDVQSPAAFRQTCADAMLAARQEPVPHELAGGGVIHIGRTPVKENGFAVGVSACIRLAHGIEPGADDRRQMETHGLQKRFSSMRELARFCCEAEGKSVSAAADDKVLFSTAISTNSFPIALGDSANKSLQSGYALVEKVFLQNFGRKNVRDFKEYKHILMSNFSRPAMIASGGELPYLKFTETAQTYKADTYGGLFVWSRTQQVNDDLGFFTEAMQMLGTRMAEEFEQLGCDKLTEGSGLGPLMSDGVRLFATTRTEGGETVVNYATGAGTALADSSLSTAQQYLMKQKQGDLYLSLLPDFVLVPAELHHTARRLLLSPLLAPSGQTATTAMEGTTNVNNGVARPVTSPRLSGKTNGTTAWYVCANQRQYPSLVAVTLNGVESPTVETVDLPGNILGFGIRAYLDMGWSVVDWRSIVRMKGAA